MLSNRLATWRFSGNSAAGSNDSCQRRGKMMKNDQEKTHVESLWGKLNFQETLDGYLSLWCRITPCKCLKRTNTIQHLSPARKTALFSSLLFRTLPGTPLLWNGESAAAFGRGPFHIWVDYIIQNPMICCVDHETGQSSWLSSRPRSTNVGQIYGLCLYIPQWEFLRCVQQSTPF